MDGRTVMACVDAAHAALKEHEDELATLDQQIGDGDHIFNLLRGFDAVFALRPELEAKPVDAALQLAAMKVLSTVGGSAGPLLFSLLDGMGKSFAAQPSACVPLASVARAFAAGVEAVERRGKTGTGSKTMMDVLIPVSTHFCELAAAGAAPAVARDELPRVAEQGMLATRDMLATKGRASFLGERSRGHIDPGARSSQLMIAAVCAQLAREPH
jgi:phosphoenolpyruvate---glycerone phosphotransferase subunit DhaL